MRDRRPTFAGIAACCAIAAAGCAPGPRAPRVDERNLRTPEEGAKSLDMQGRSAAAAAASRGAADAAQTAGQHALVIGVSKYADAAVPALQFARGDAERVCSFFVDEAGLAIPPARVRL